MGRVHANSVALRDTRDTRLWQRGARDVIWVVVDLVVAQRMILCGFVNGQAL